MKKILFMMSIFGLLIGISACDLEKYDVVATIFPHYDLAKNIVKDKLKVKLLTPIGSEAHALELTSKDYMTIENAGLFIFTSMEFDQAFINEKMADAANALNMEEALEEHLHEAKRPRLAAGDHEHEHDSHYWTNPQVAISMLEIIYERIIAIDSANQAFYEANMREYASKILVVSEDFLTYLTDKNDKTIYFAGHMALEGFAEYFGLDIEALSDTFQPDADITSAQIAALVDKIRAANAKYLFIEEIKEPRIAITIKNELGAAYNLLLLELHGYHNLSQSDYMANMTYLSLLERNINNLKEAIK